MFNVTPMAAAAYFNKVECFCFTETTLKPGEEMKMPVVFFVDPEIVKTVETKNIRTLTLSYTFYAQRTFQALGLVEDHGRRDRQETLIHHCFRLCRK